MDTVSQLCVFHLVRGRDGDAGVSDATSTPEFDWFDYWVAIRAKREWCGQDNSTMENMLEPISHADLIGSSREAVDAIKTAAGLSDRQFGHLCMPVIRAYAEFVQRLPLSAVAFSSSRGAWEFGLTAAMVTYRYAGSVMFFPALGSEERRILEPQCRYMAFLATLATAVATVSESASLTASDDEYHPLGCDITLHAWLLDHPSPKFSWRVPAAPLSAPASSAIAAKFIPKGLLANFDLRAILMMYEAVTPRTTMSGVESTMARVVRLSTQGVLDHYRTKQAGTYLPGTNTNTQTVTAAEASNLAAKMVAAANPTVLVNPLEAPASAAPALTTSQAPSAVNVPGPAAGRPRPAPEQHQAAAVQAATDSPNTPVSAAAASGGEDVLARAPKVLREWFSALAQHPQFHVLKDQLKMSDEGIEVLLPMLGMFGVSSPMIRKLMDEAGLIVRRSDNARGLILHPGLRNRFVSQ